MADPEEPKNEIVNKTNNPTDNEYNADVGLPRMPQHDLQGVQVPDGDTCHAPKEESKDYPTQHPLPPKPIDIEPIDDNKASTPTRRRNKALTPRRLKFVQEYLSNGLTNASEAARRAGYKANSAGTMANHLKKEPEIKQAIARALKKYDLTAHRYAREISKGLDKAKMSEHGFYVKELKEQLGLGKTEAAPPVSINAWIERLEVSRSERGLDEKEKENIE